jgi:hypothetical protein
MVSNIFGLVIPAIDKRGIDGQSLFVQLDTDDSLCRLLRQIRNVLSYKMRIFGTRKDRILTELSTNHFCMLGDAHLLFISIMTLVIMQKPGYVVCYDRIILRLIRFGRLAQAGLGLVLHL